jgi:hypothetical protein
MQHASLSAAGITDNPKLNSKCLFSYPVFSPPLEFGLPIEKFSSPFFHRIPSP